MFRFYVENTCTVLVFRFHNIIYISCICPLVTGKYRFWSTLKFGPRRNLLPLIESDKKGCTGSFCKCCGNFLWFQVCNSISLLHLGYIDKSKYKVSINLTGLDKIAKFDSVILEVSYNMHYVFISKIGHANNIPLLQFMSGILRISKPRCYMLLLHAIAITDWVLFSMPYWLELQENSRIP